MCRDNTTFNAAHQPCRRLLEEAQGQRRLVSFGGAIALSAGSSQSSTPGKGRGGNSLADAFELSSDDEPVTEDNIGNDDDLRGSGKRAEADECGQIGDDDYDDDDDDAFVSPLKKTPDGNRAKHVDNNGKGDTSGSAAVASKGGKAGRKSDPTDRRREAPRRSGGPRGRKPSSGTGLDGREGTKKRSVRSSLEAFERIIEDEDFDLDDLAVAAGGGNVPLTRDGGASGGGMSGGAARGNGVRGSASDDECCEILFTRVRPAANPSS